MKIPEKSVSYDEVKFNLDNGILEMLEQMLEQQEKAELERDSE